MMHIAESHTKPNDINFSFRIVFARQDFSGGEVEMWQIEKGFSTEIKNC